MKTEGTPIARVAGVTIEKGIPIPSNHRDGGPTEVLTSMTKGDSVTVPMTKRASYTTAAHRLGISLVTRTVDESHVRIWRAS